VDAALVTIIVEGDVSAVKAAVEAGVKVAKRTGALIAFNVIPHPDVGTNALLIEKEIQADKKEVKQTEKQIDSVEDSKGKENSKSE
jgi:microcompartment protein CcmL/EutN